MIQPTTHIREQIVGHLPRLRRFARTLARNSYDADDLVQIAVERALLRIGQWRPDSNLLSWLFGIVRNAWIDEARSRGRRDRLFAPEDAARDVGVHTADAATIILSVQAALERLPEEQRAVIALVLIEGLSYRQAAEVLGIPIGTLTSRLARGRAALTTVLEERR